MNVGNRTIAALTIIAPVSSTSRTGDMGVLTFQFVDPITGSMASSPEIGSVFYEVNIDPLNPDVFMALGFSFDSSSNFTLRLCAGRI